MDLYEKINTLYYEYDSIIDGFSNIDYVSPHNFLNESWALELEIDKEYYRNIITEARKARAIGDIDRVKYLQVDLKNLTQFVSAWCEKHGIDDPIGTYRWQQPSGSEVRRLKHFIITKLRTDSQIEIFSEYTDGILSVMRMGGGSDVPTHSLRVSVKVGFGGSVGGLISVRRNDGLPYLVEFENISGCSLARTIRFPGWERYQWKFDLTNIFSDFNNNVMDIILEIERHVS